jgi:hypothetical protein
LLEIQEYNDVDVINTIAKSNKLFQEISTDEFKDKWDEAKIKDKSLKISDILIVYNYYINESINLLDLYNQPEFNDFILKTIKKA